MPNRDGTGPMGQGRGFGKGNPGLGGRCVCPQCGEKISHERGVPCNIVSCPKCGTKMVREN